MTCADCARLAELEEENRQLRRELAFSVDAARGKMLAKHLGITPQQGLIVTALYAAKGRPIAPWDIADAIGSSVMKDGFEQADVIRVQVSKIRTAVHPSFISNVWGAGYYMSEAARARCDAILSQAQQVAA